MHQDSASGKRTAIAVFVFIIISFSTLQAQQTAGLFVYDSASFTGYTLFTPSKSKATYLIDNYGRVVNQWESAYLPAQSVYLLENGNILRSAKIPGGVGFEEVAWDGTVVWFYDNSSTTHRQHHDIEPLPNGNVLVLVREFKTEAEAIAAGRDPATIEEGQLACEGVYEIAKTGPTSGNVVWQWSFWEHLIQDFDSTKNNYGVVADHPELLDINFARNGLADWIHTNGIAYNEELDQIVISSRNTSEIYIIDHSTTSHEADTHAGGNSGKGGDILYRWGNPQAYRAGTAADQKFFGQHDAQWIAAGLPGEGNILVFNNGIERPDLEYSSVDEIVTTVQEDGSYLQPSPGEAFGPAQPTWVYSNEIPENFYSPILSGVHRLPNGNTLVCSATKGRIFEVTPPGSIVWEYKNPDADFGIAQQGQAIPEKSNEVFKCRRYAPDYPGLAGIDLNPAGEIEIYPVHISGATNSPSQPTSLDPIIITADITDSSGIAMAEAYIDTGAGYFAVAMFDDGLHNDGQAGDDRYGAVIPPVSEQTSVSYYIYAQDGADSSAYDPPNAPDIIYSFVVEEASGYVCGDANGDSDVNVGDAVSVINYVFKGGPAPNPLCAGNANGDGEVNVGDGVYLINYVFKGGPGPDANCCR